MTMHQPIKQDFISLARDRVDGLIRWRAHIEKALARNGTLFSYEECCQRVLAGTLMWFNNDESFAIVEILTFAKGSVFHILISGGKYDAMCELEGVIVDLAKNVGVHRLTTLGRDGFLRRKRPDGWKPTRQQFFMKEI